MSARDRHYRALRRQGKLTEEQRRVLKSDLLDLLNGKDHPKSESEVMAQLVRHCGWDRHKMFGPRPLVESCLYELETDGLAESDTYRTERDLNLNQSRWWITPDGAEARDARITYNAKAEAAKLAAQMADEAELSKGWETSSISPLNIPGLD